jgi:hypothetical protein
MDVYISLFIIIKCQQTVKSTSGFANTCERQPEEPYGALCKLENYVN